MSDANVLPDVSVEESDEADLQHAQCAYGAVNYAKYIHGTALYRMKTLLESQSVQD